MFQITLRSARVNSRLSIKEASDLAGIHHQTLARYEKDSSNISVTLLNKLSEIYQVPSDFIFLGKEYELTQTITNKRNKLLHQV